MFDPETGERRRELLRDQLERMTKTTGEAMSATWRDARHRMQEVMASLQSSLSNEPASDRELAERTREGARPGAPWGVL